VGIEVHTNYTVGSKHTIQSGNYTQITQWEVHTNYTVGSKHTIQSGNYTQITHWEVNTRLHIVNNTQVNTEWELIQIT